MKHRSWDEVGCEFHDIDPNYVPDSEEDTIESIMTLEPGLPGIKWMEIGRFNGGRHVYLEYKATNAGAARFEKAFMIVMKVYDFGFSGEELEEAVKKCDDLRYLRKREKEWEAEADIVNEEFEKKQAAKESRWRSSEWYDAERLMQAARDAGWQEDEVNPKYPRNFHFYHDIQPDKPCESGRKTWLRLELCINDNRDIVPDLWLHDNVSIIWEGGGSSCFGNWNMMPHSHYVQNIEFIDRWLGIPSPQQAVAALKQVCTWDEHMRHGCEDYSL